MKKIISILLALTLIVGSIVPVFAKEDSTVIVATDVQNVADAVGCEYPIVFVTGIG